MESPAALSDSNDYSSYVSNGDSLSNDSFKPPNVVALNCLFENLGFLFLSPDFDFCADARILVPPSSAVTASCEIPIHRCILSTRSPFFFSIFSTAADANPAKEKGWKIELKELAKDFDLGYDSLVSILTYLYSGKARPLPDVVCICVDEKCSHVAYHPAVDFMVEVLYGAFTFQIMEMVTLYQVGWLTQNFAVYGLNDHFVSKFKEKIDIPHQDNENDCGVFTCAFAEHCILQKPFKLTQADIPLYQSKIVLEIFKRTWVINSYRLDLSALD